MSKVVHGVRSVCCLVHSPLSDRSDMKKKIIFSELIVVEEEDTAEVNTDDA